jgi:hypothetical protein
MPQLGKKYTCYSCHTKFYDLGKPVPTCPKCGADQRDAEDTPVVSTGRGRSRVAPPPVVEPEATEDDDLGGDADSPVAPPAGGDDEEDEIVGAPEREEEPEEDEEEEY